MKSISASIIVLAATILLLAGALIQHSDTALFLQAVGCFVGAIAIGGWIVTLRSPKDASDAD